MKPCTKQAIPPRNAKSARRSAEHKFGIPFFAYDCPFCGKIHLTTVMPGALWVDKN